MHLWVAATEDGLVFFDVIEEDNSYSIKLLEDHYKNNNIVRVLWAKPSIDNDDMLIIYRDDYYYKLYNRNTR